MERFEGPPFSVFWIMTSVLADFAYVDFLGNDCCFGVRATFIFVELGMYGTSVFTHTIENLVQHISCCLKATAETSPRSNRRGFGGCLRCPSKESDHFDHQKTCPTPSPRYLQGPRLFRCLKHPPTASLALDRDVFGSPKAHQNRSPALATSKHVVVFLVGFPFTKSHGVSFV